VSTGPSRVRRSPVAWLLALSLSACMSPVTLRAAALTARRPADPGSAEAPAPQPAPRGAPLVRITPVVDRRTDTSSDQVAGRTFDAPELGQWLDHELRSIASREFRVAEGGGEEASARITLRPRILKAYVSAVAATKTAAVVLEVEWVLPDGTAERHLYRGQHASMNWGSSESEMIGALQEAAAACTAQLRGEIEARLRGAAAPART
jgi:uncharacterized lipoprotein YmbA